MNNDELIAYLEDLSNLSLTDGEKKRFAADLSAAREEFKNLAQLDTSGFEPNEKPQGLFNVFRDDVPIASLDRDLLLRNAPFHNDEMITAPKTVGD